MWIIWSHEPVHVRVVHTHQTELLPPMGLPDAGPAGLVPQQQFGSPHLGSGPRANWTRWGTQQFDSHLPTDLSQACIVAGGPAPAPRLHLLLGPQPWATATKPRHALSSAMRPTPLSGTVACSAAGPVHTRCGSRAVIPPLPCRQHISSRRASGRGARCRQATRCSSSACGRYEAAARQRSAAAGLLVCPRCCAPPS